MERRDPRRTFSQSAGRYLTSSDHRSGPDLERIREIASSLFPSVTLDVACGAGHALWAASPFSGICLAADLTMEMLRVARRHLAGAGLKDVLFLQSSGDRLPLAAGTISFLTCRIAPHHFPSVPGFLSEVVRVLEPEGRAVIIDSIAPAKPEEGRFINEVERLRDPSHVCSHSFEEWLDFFRRIELVVVSANLFERRHSFPEWVSRTGTDEEKVREIERRFLDASEGIRERFKVESDCEGGVLSYSDEKGIFVLRKGQGKR